MWQKKKRKSSKEKKRKSSKEKKRRKNGSGKRNILIRLLKKVQSEKDQSDNYHYTPKKKSKKKRVCLYALSSLILFVFVYKNMTLDKWNMFKKKTKKTKG